MKTSGSSKRGLVLVLVLVALLGVAGALVGTLVIYPAREKGKIVAAYGEMQTAANALDFAALERLTTGAAAADIEQLASLCKTATAFQLGPSLQVTVTVDKTKVKVKGKTAEADVKIEGTIGASKLGLSGPISASGVHKLVREDGQWKVSDWGETGLTTNLPSLNLLGG